jgi:hypothetical protein
MSEHWRQFLDSDVIRFVDLDREYTFKIVKVKKEKVIGAGGKSSSKGMIWFDGPEKPVAAGSTVLAVIASLYGDKPSAWVGRWLTIYPDPTVKYGGAAVGGVRVRPNVPAPELCVPPPPKKGPTK